MNYEDDRLKEVEKKEQSYMSEVNKTYGNAINTSKDHFNKQIDAAGEWGQKQQEIQQANTDFAIEKIEQQKEQAHKDYLKEQSGAYVDWQKESNRYGANAEQMAAGGLQGTGYSESSQVSMYNTYQNRIATAREAYGQAVLNYDNNIKEAQLQNSSALARIAFETLQTQLSLALQGFQYENTLLTEQLNAKMQVDSHMHSQYMDILSQINQENDLAEEKRQFDLSLEEEKRQFNVENNVENNYHVFGKEDESGGGNESIDSGIPGRVTHLAALKQTAYGIKSKEALAEYLVQQVNAGSISEQHAEQLMLEIGMQKGW